MKLINKAHEIMKDLPIDDKKKMLNYINNYRSIINNSYQEKEDLLYQNFGVFNTNDKIFFELTRIKKYLLDNYIVEKDFEDSIKYIEDNIDILSKMQTNFSKNQKEKQIINDILELELSLNMKITLYNEFIEYFQEKIFEYDESFQKKRN